MSGVKCIACSGAVSLSGSTAKTVLQLKTATHHRAVLEGLSVTVAGTSAVDLTIRLLRQTTDGTAGTTTGLIAKVNPNNAETIQTTGAANFSAEPTPGDLLQYKKLQGAYEKYFPFSGEIPVPGGTRIGVEVTAASAATVAVELAFEE